MVTLLLTLALTSGCVFCIRVFHRDLVRELRKPTPDHYRLLRTKRYLRDAYMLITLVWTFITFSILLTISS